jgi:regulator of replication initiation timing
VNQLEKTRGTAQQLTERTSLFKEANVMYITLAFPHPEAAVRPSYEDLLRENRRLRKENQALKERLSRLEAELAAQGGKRKAQAHLLQLRTKS